MRSCIAISVIRSFITAGRGRLSGPETKVNRMAATSLVEGEAEPQGDLIMRDLAGGDMAARFLDLEPPDVVDRPGGAGDGGFDRILDAGRRAADDLDDLVDMVAHDDPPAA